MGFCKYDHVVSGAQHASASRYLRIAISNDGREKHVTGKTEISNGRSVCGRFGRNFELYDFNISIEECCYSRYIPTNVTQNAVGASGARRQRRVYTTLL